MGNADILSNSWGGGVPDIDINNQIFAARTQGRGGRGAIVVASSGNSHPNGILFPASADGVITVGAIKNTGSIWEYSNRGVEMDLVAPSGNLGNRTPQFCIIPGGNVRTTDRMGANGYETGNYSNGFGGTSAAAPQVSGVAALMLSVNPNLTEAQVRTFLQQSAWDMGASGFDNTFGHGRLNAYAAVRAALPPITGPEFLCSSNSYNITNLPAGTVATWSVSPSSLFSGSTSGSGTSVNLSPSSALPSGQATLTFNLNYGCGSFQVQRTIWVGKGTIGIYGAYDIPTNTVENYYATTDGSVTNYNWSVYPSGYEWIGNQGTSGITLTISYPGNYSLGLDVTNPCGVRGSEIQIYVYDPWSMFMIYPNPASDIMTVSKKSTLSSKQVDTTPFEISVFDSRGQQLAGPVSGNEDVGLDVSHLKNGFYYVHIMYNGHLIKNQIKVER